MDLSCIKGSYRWDGVGGKLGEENEQWNLISLGDQIKMVKDRMKNMENFNINMANQMLKILNFLNDYIVSLYGMLKAKEFVVDEEGNSIEEDRMEEDTITDIIQSHKDQSYVKDMDWMAEDLQRIKDAIETI